MRSKLFLVLFILVILIFSPSQAFSFWMWTPETNKWVNPKFSVKETPFEQLQYALTFYEKKDYKEAIKEFDKLIKHYPRAREAPEAQYYKALALEDQGELFAAFKEYQVVVDKYPFSERGAEVIQKEYDLGLKLLEGQANKGKFIEAFTGTDYNVVEVFRTVIKNAPYGHLAPPAQYKIGLYLLEKKLYQEARDEFEKLMNDYPESKWANAAKYQIAVADAQRSTGAQYDQKVTSSAVEEFHDFLKENPDAELTEKAKKQILDLREKEAENNFVIAQFYEKQKNYAAAKIYYQVIVDDYADSTWATKALNKIREVGEKKK